MLDTTNARCWSCDTEELVPTPESELRNLYDYVYDEEEWLAALCEEYDGFLVIMSGLGRQWVYNEVTEQWQYYCRAHGGHDIDPDWCCDSEEHDYA